MAVITYDADSTTLILNGEPILDLVDGDTITMTPVNPHTSHITSTNGGVTINKRSDSDVYDLTVNCQKGGRGDRFFQSALNSESVVVLNGSLKQDYSRDGTDGVDSWLLENGSITTLPTDTKNNTDGNASMSYTVRFRNARRNV